MAFRELALLSILLSALSSFDAVARPDCDATPDIPPCGGNGGGSGSTPGGGGNTTGSVREGGLYREVGAPEVFIIQGGKKVWIPTPDALFAMGYKWDNVQVVPDGKLQAYPRANIPSSSATPGSLIFPPNGVKLFPLAFMPNALRLVSQGKEIQLTELFGWLWKDDSDEGNCNGAEGDGADFHYNFELDSRPCKIQIDAWLVGIFEADRITLAARIFAEPDRRISVNQDARNANPKRPRRPKRIIARINQRML